MFNKNESVHEVILVTYCEFEMEVDGISIEAGQYDYSALRQCLSNNAWNELLTRDDARQRRYDEILLNRNEFK